MNRRTVAAAATLIVLLVACSGSDEKSKPSTSSKPSSTSSARSAAAPAPAGFVPISTPSGVSPDLFGQNVAVTTTKDGRAVVAFSVHAADGDASTVMTSTFDVASNTFQTPVTVATGQLYDQVHSVDVARDD